MAFRKRVFHGEVWVRTKDSSAVSTWQHVRAWGWWAETRLCRSSLVSDDEGSLTLYFYVNSQFSSARPCVINGGYIILDSPEKRNLQDLYYNISYDIIPSQIYYKELAHRFKEAESPKVCSWHL